MADEHADPPDGTPAREPTGGIGPTFGLSSLRSYGRLVLHLLRWVALGSVVGVLAGLSSAAFLWALDLATAAFDEHPGLLYGLPVAGLCIGLVYHYGGGRAVEGNNLIIDEIHEPTEWVPRRMAPMVFVGTVVTHLFGGSAGREGTAIQMSGSLTDVASRAFRLDPSDRRTMLIAALAGGFGAVFGVPLAERCSAWRSSRSDGCATRRWCPRSSRRSSVTWSCVRWGSST